MLQSASVTLDEVRRDVTERSRESFAYFQTYVLGHRAEPDEVCRAIRAAVVSRSDLHVADVAKPERLAAAFQLYVRLCHPGVAVLPALSERVSAADPWLLHAEDASDLEDGVCFVETEPNAIRITWTTSWTTYLA